MIRTTLVVLLLGMAGTALAEDPASSPDADAAQAQRDAEQAQREAARAQREAQQEAARAQREAQAEAARSAEDADLDAKLEAARRRLEAAAREVGQLSGQLGREGMQVFAQEFGSHAVLGLVLQTDQGDMDRGVRVLQVSPGGPAAEAGIRPGDVIVALDGAVTTGPEGARDIVERLRGVQPGSRVAVRVMRDGKPREFSVVPRERAADVWGVGGVPQVLARVHLPDLGDLPGLDFGAPEFGGMELASLSPQLGAYFGTTQGVLVIRAPEGGGLSLQDGDVIEAIDGRVPQNGAHASRILRSYQPGEKIHLKVMRRRKVLELTATLPGVRFDPRGRAAPGCAPGEPGPCIRGAVPALPVAPAPPAAPAPPTVDIPHILPGPHLVPLADASGLR
ncbi:MAG TPA: PDZ domain-containing protein [Steroidobacteraceae bacterium]|nr:PDZ domain-containing protein [Steroidobacteraceae bacterium]